MTDYLLEILIFQLAFLLIYEIWLQKETFFNLNRAYLLATPLLSLLIPFIRITSLQKTTPAIAFQNLSDKTMVLLPEVFIGNRTATTAASQIENDIQLNWWLILYFLGATIAFGVFLYKLYKLEKISRSSRPIKQKYYDIFEIPNSDAAYTYFNQLYIGDRISAEDRKQIITHELVHLDERHGVDLMTFEILKIVLWFNPLIYLFQSKLAVIHEYIADETTVKKSGKKQYFEQLLNTAFGTSNITFTNQFFNHSLIKKRIVMLQKNKSGKLKHFKFLLIIPVLLLMLTYVACSQDDELEAELDLQQYSYELGMDKSFNSDPKLKEQHDKYETFLLNNPDYVSWATIDYSKKQISYSVHPKTERVPEGYNPMELAFKNGGTYTMYINLRDSANTGNSSATITKSQDSGNNMKDVPFAVVDKAPAFPDCEEFTSNDERKKCTSEKISMFVNQNFNTNIGKELGLTGISRIIVQFKIGQDGNIAEVRARSSREELKEEAIRVINSLPKMTPGEQNGQKVSVMYSLPIAFQTK
ncbi:M56 family metallopeptidase [Christiangramia flava]|uniref:Regulatory sensor-transducer, BlaR1/MecR1 family n=1 Tax=Christiangramia flava JLT2011 TaxID=1229726 RepID=A0A1L7I5W6_9FLAO|nr:M56 family metallopeptidase [Christiangramia flava]APU68573.1 Regulatory sensor-transducer, BlaR1/MecR1 family [Christiangramia flava JLT2011]